MLLKGAKTRSLFLFVFVFVFLFFVCLFLFVFCFLFLFCFVLFCFVLCFCKTIGLNNSFAVIEKKIRFLTLKWPKYFYSHWCPGGPWKTTFPPEFCNEICTIYVWAIKITILQKKKYRKCCTISKWQPNNWFLFRLISIFAKIWKTTFPNEFFNEI